VPAWLGATPPGFMLLENGTHIGLWAVSGAAHLISGLLEALNWSANTPFLALFLVLVLRVLLRSRLAAAAVFATVWTISIMQFENAPLELLAYGTATGMLTWMLLRVGVLAAAASAVAYSLGYMPMTLDTASWYFYATSISLGLTAALAVYGFYFSLAGKPLLGAKLLEA
jgi:hypothetical protein